MQKIYKKNQDKEGVVDVVETSSEIIERTLEDVNNDIAGIEKQLANLQTEKTAITEALK